MYFLIHLRVKKKINDLFINLKETGEQRIRTTSIGRVARSNSYALPSNGQ